MDSILRRSSWGRWESSCLSNCGQAPPEITATLTTPSRSWRSDDISASSEDLLAASVPSRSKTISFFTILSFRAWRQGVRKYLYRVARACCQYLNDELPSR